MIKQFPFKQFNLALVSCLYADDMTLLGATRPELGLGAMAKKGYFTFPKVPALLEPHHQIV